jgi:hypothetical protein
MYSLRSLLRGFTVNHFYSTDDICVREMPAAFVRNGVGADSVNERNLSCISFGNIIYSGYSYCPFLLHLFPPSPSLFFSFYLLFFIVSAQIMP